MRATVRPRSNMKRDTRMLVGAARVGSDSARSMVNPYGRTHDIANCLISQGTSVFDSSRRDMTPPPIRPELPATRHTRQRHAAAAMKIKPQSSRAR